MQTLKMIFREIYYGKISVLAFLSLMIITFFMTGGDIKVQEKSAQLFLIMYPGIAAMRILNLMNREKRAIMLNNLPISRRKSSFIQFSILLALPLLSLCLALILWSIGGYDIREKLNVFLFLGYFVIINIGSFSELELPNLKLKSKSHNNEYKRRILLLRFISILLILIVLSPVFYSVIIDFTFFEYLIDNNLIIPLGIAFVIARSLIFIIIKDKTDLLDLYNSEFKKAPIERIFSN